MNIENVLFIIDRIRDEWYKPPENYYTLKRSVFEYQSYKRSAINEIKLYLIEHKNENPIDVMEDFRYQMDCFACETKNGNTNFMFSIYYDVATDILDALLEEIRHDNNNNSSKTFC